ncbi:hypothetical protein CEUSTIGMA_g7472.t1 [Chlamydomonas eustigma]|uniref:OsmC-like protein n=1 Tax=Chlamydomonas eustigma TaxID=1157962 RepID=A0A250XA90_9CHLO|nr:hypothetical protein CEUSTIGMA_g7472.t1 [Chlamydomonas eustigma]|eukprot:GAX80033.1 hypothetical protein CEUSTIGMA_g7472.t1 [Chlamydomonas eustigma]
MICSSLRGTKCLLARAGSLLTSSNSYHPLRYWAAVRSNSSSSTRIAATADDSITWRKEYRIQGQGFKNQCTVQTEDDFIICSDIPKSMGGGNSAPQPVLLLLAALAGCETATANFVARHLKIRIRGISFEIEAWRDQRGALSLPITQTEGGSGQLMIPAMLQVVSGTAVVDTDSTQEEVDELSHQVHIRCPVASMMTRSGCQLNIKWIKKSE